MNPQCSRQPGSWVARCLILPSALVWAVVAPAQSLSEPASGMETLKRLIMEYQMQRDSIERPLLAAYAQKLIALKDTLEKRRDPAAAEVAAELDKIQALLATGATATPRRTESPSSAPAPTAPIELPGRKAQTTGGATAVGDDNSPVQFAGKGSMAEWILPKLPAGRYRMMWRIACEVGAGATVRLSIDGQPPRTLEVVPTSASGDAILANLGEFTASVPPTSVRLEVLSLPGSGRPRKEGPSFSVARVILIPPGVTMPGL